MVFWISIMLLILLEVQKRRIYNIYITNVLEGIGLIEKKLKNRIQWKKKLSKSSGLAAIHAATSNFSDSNKLGEGGFGPVYKGLT
ncbi:hypothetical protein CerSpe_211580 [Prunus speciosa]